MELNPFAIQLLLHDELLIWATHELRHGLMVRVRRSVTELRQEALIKINVCLLFVSFYNK